MRNLSNLSLTLTNTNFGYVSYYAKAILSAEEESIYTFIDDYKLYYNEAEDSYALIEYLGSATEVILPSSFQEKSYTLTDAAFASRIGMNKIIFPENITTIPSYCFLGNDFKELTIPQ